MLLRFRKTAEETAAALPALMALAQKAASSILHGGHARRKAGSGENFWQFREYQTGDRPQDIDWRQSAKTDRVFIREREEQGTQVTAFWMAGHKGMNFSSSAEFLTKAQTGTVIALALGILLQHSGELLAVFGQKQPGRSQGALEKIGRALLDENRGGPIPDSIEFTRGAMTVLIGDFLSNINEIETSISQITSKSADILLIQILDPAECDLPYGGRAIFEDPDSETIEPIANIPSIRESYKSRINNHLDDVESLCARHGVHYFFHRTDRPAAEVLSRIHLRIDDLKQHGRTA